MSDKVFIPSLQQTTFFGTLRDNPNRNVVLQALAGTGKTTTAVEACKSFPQGSSVLFCAFARRNAEDLVKRLPSHVQAKTLHALGLSTIVANYGKVTVDNDKGKHVAENTLRDEGKAINGVIPYDHIKAVSTLATLGKACMAIDLNDLMDLAQEFRVSLSGDEDENPTELARLAQKAMIRACKTTSHIDYDDMLGFPWMLKLQPKTLHDVVIVDECQDMNASQLHLARKMVKPQGRIIIIGDPNQAIYGFRGADVGGMERMTQELDAISLPLSLTYRCPKSVVTLAKSIVPHYEAYEGNIEGNINIVNTESMKTLCKPGSYILSRKNAPLMGLCLSFLAKGIPACVSGRDIGKTLKSIVVKSKTKDIVGLTSWIETYRQKEIQKTEGIPHDKAERKISDINDRCDCILALTEDCETIACVLDKMERIFSDTNPESSIVLSSVHKAKGGERKDVYVLEETFRNGKGIPEEDRIWYVAITRTMETLNIVRDTPKVS